MRDLSRLYLELFGDCIKLINILSESDITDNNILKVKGRKFTILRMLRYDRNYTKDMVLVLNDIEVELISILKKDERYTNNISFYEDILLVFISRTKIISGYRPNKEETDNHLDSLYNSFLAFYNDDTNDEVQILFELDRITREVKQNFWNIFSVIENPDIQ